MRWVVAATFAAMAVWVLIPDKLDQSPDSVAPRRNAFLTTLICFFLAEIGDKTQIATAVIAAEYHPLWQVVAGTTTGMLLADVPVVWLGARFAQRLPLRATRMVAAALFAGLAVWILFR